MVYRGVGGSWLVGLEFSCQLETCAFGSPFDKFH